MNYRRPEFLIRLFIKGLFLLYCSWCRQTFPQTPSTLPAVPLIKPVVNRDYLPTVLELIAGAKKTIDFIQLEFHYDPTVKRIQDALREAVKRGVRVRGLIEDDIKFNQTSEKYLKQSGIDAALDTPKKMTHSKLFIFDGEGILLGSTNLSGNSIDNNNETNVYVKDRRLGDYFERYFEKLREDSFAEPSLAPLSLPNLRTVINRQYFDEVFKLLSSARKEIGIIMYGIRYYERYPDSRTNRLLQALVEARRRGVEVRVLMDLSDYNQKLNEINEETRRFLAKGGVAVKYDREDVTSHAKLLIVDGSVVVGSANWGYDALERRNETSLIISDPETVAYFRDYFSRLWGEGGGPASAPSPAWLVPAATPRPRNWPGE